LGLRVILDGVFNHTSDQHPWFCASRQARGDAPERSLYIWRPPRPGARAGSRAALPNNWCSQFGSAAWTLDAQSGEYYLHSFAAGQPDLNWRNPEVLRRVLSVLRFWLRLGVDGFRLDVFNRYLKDAALRSNPYRGDLLSRCARLLYPDYAQLHVFDQDQFADMQPVLAAMRAAVDEFGGVLVGETDDVRMRYDMAARYAGPGKLHLTFNFRLLLSRFEAAAVAGAVRDWSAQLGGGWPSWVIDNHDQARSRSRWAAPWWWLSASRRDAATAARCRAAALLLLTLRGTAFIFQGQEIGMAQRSMRRSEIQDPAGKPWWPLYQGRDGCRTPMQWTGEEPDAGFGPPAGEKHAPWLPLNGDFRRGVNVEQELREPGSLLCCYRNLLRLRRASPALQHGAMELWPAAPNRGFVSFTRTLGDERLLVHINMTDRRAAPPALLGKLLFSTVLTRASGVDCPPAFEPFEGVILAMPCAAAKQHQL
jgi:alpha-glucosidase